MYDLVLEVSAPQRVVRRTGAARLAWLVLAAGLGGPGCSTSSASGAGAQTAPERCYEGHIVILAPTGRAVGQSKLVLRRYFDPKTGRWDDHTLSYDLRPKAPPEIYWVRRIIREDSFSYEETHTGTRGSGRLVGPAWAWTEASAELELDDGHRVQVKEQFGEQIDVEKRLFGPDRALLMTFREHLEPIEAEPCAERFSAAEAAIAAAAAAP